MQIYFTALFLVILTSHCRPPTCPKNLICRNCFVFICPNLEWNVLNCPRFCMAKRVLLNYKNKRILDSQILSNHIHFSSFIFSHFLSNLGKSPQISVNLVNDIESWQHLVKSTQFLSGEGMRWVNFQFYQYSVLDNRKEKISFWL